MPTPSLVVSPDAEYTDSLMVDECDGDDEIGLDQRKTMVKSLSPGYEGVEEIDSETVKMLMADIAQLSVVSLRKNAPKLLRLSGFVVNKNLDKMKNLWEKRPEGYDEKKYFGDPTNGAKIGEKWDPTKKKLIPQRKKPRKEELIDMYRYLVDICRQKYKNQLDRDEYQRILEGDSKPKIQEKAQKNRPSKLINKQLQEMIDGCSRRLQIMQATIPTEDLALMTNNLSVVKKMHSDAMTLLDLTRDTCGSLHNLLNNVERRKQLSSDEKENCREFYDNFADCDFINVPGQQILLESSEPPTLTPGSTKMSDKLETAAEKSVLNWHIKSEGSSPQRESCSFSPARAGVTSSGHTVFQASSVEPLSMGSISIGHKKESQNLPVTVTLLNEEDNEMSHSMIAQTSSPTGDNENRHFKVDAFTISQMRKTSPNRNFHVTTEKELSDSLSRTTLASEPQSDNVIYAGLSTIDMGESNRTFPYNTGRTTTEKNIIMETTSSPTHQKLLPSIEDFFQNQQPNLSGGRHDSSNYKQFGVGDGLCHFWEPEQNALALSTDELLSILQVDNSAMFEEGSDLGLSLCDTDLKKMDTELTNHSTSLKRQICDNSSGIKDKRMRRDEDLSDE